jgi:hypothetical protein
MRVALVLRNLSCVLVHILPCLRKFFYVLTFICLRWTLLLKVAHRAVTLTSRASVTLTRMRAHYVVGGTVFISHCYIVASFVIVPLSCA